MKKTKNFYIILSVSIFFILVGLILGTIYDLDISKTLATVEEGSYYTTNKFAILGETFGEDILYIIVECALAIIFCYLVKNPLKKDIFNTLLFIVLVVCGGCVCFYAINKTLNYMITHNLIHNGEFYSSVLGKITVIFVSLSIHAIIFFLFSKVKNEDLKALLGWAITVVVIAILSNAIVQGTKLIFDRTRFRAMVYERDTTFEHFTPWYQINQNKFATTSQYASDYFKSFPSGHTCAASSIFLLTLLPMFYKKVDTKEWKIFFYVVAIIYTVSVAFSRIIAGAHFFTDVYIAGLVTITLIFIAKYFVIERFVALPQKVNNAKNNITQTINNEPIKEVMNKEENIQSSSIQNQQENEKIDNKNIESKENSNNLDNKKDTPDNTEN